jgi:hypothetical protein
MVHSNVVCVKVLFYSLSCSLYAGLKEHEIYHAGQPEPNQAPCKLKEIYQNWPFLNTGQIYRYQHWMVERWLHLKYTKGLNLRFNCLYQPINLNSSCWRITCPKFLNHGTRHTSAWKILIHPTCSSVPSTTYNLSTLPLMMSSAISAMQCNASLSYKATSCDRYMVSHLWLFK